MVRIYTTQVMLCPSLTTSILVVFAYITGIIALVAPALNDGFQTILRADDLPSRPLL